MSGLGSLRPAAVSHQSGELMLWVDVAPGTSLQSAAYTALTIALSMACAVRFNFNDATYVVDPLDFPAGWKL